QALESVFQARVALGLPGQPPALAILACWPRATLLDSTQLDVLQNEPALDEGWLTVGAAVRPPLARLEALQLESEAPLTAWRSSPGDTWRIGVVEANLTKRSAASVLIFLQEPDSPRREYLASSPDFLVYSTNFALDTELLNSTMHKEKEETL